MKCKKIEKNEMLITVSHSSHMFFFLIGPLPINSQSPYHYKVMHLSGSQDTGHAQHGNKCCLRASV